MSNAEIEILARDVAADRFCFGISKCLRCGSPTILGSFFIGKTDSSCVCRDMSCPECGEQTKMDVTYDRYGRMNFCPEIHFNQGKPWLVSDEKYLIECYEKLGPDQVSMALGRTIHTVMTRAYELRKKGSMPKRTSKTSHRRTRCMQ